MNEHARPEINHSAVAESINNATNYTMYAAFAVNRLTPSLKDPARQVAALQQSLAELPGLTIRGWYDVTGFRADTDILVWFHAPTSEALQAGYRAVLRESAGRLLPVWSNIGVHRAAEFNRSHVPAFLAGEAPGNYVCVYPFVRSKEWYLLPDEERSQMLHAHGAAARDFTDVLANTVSSFALGDYEWLLAFEANELIRLVDLMRELRATDARRHVIEETPFFTGPRRDMSELLTQAYI